MASKKAYQEMLEAQLKEWDAKIDLMRAKAEKMQAEVKIEFENQLQALRAKRDEANAKLRDLQKRSEDAWEDLREGTQKAWDEFSKAAEKFFSRFK